MSRFKALVRRIGAGEGADGTGIGGIVAWRRAVPAERKPLEMVARPLTFIDID